MVMLEQCRLSLVDNSRFASGYGSGSAGSARVSDPAEGPGRRSHDMPSNYGDLSLTISRAIFLFFVGMPAGSVRSKDGDPLDTSPWAWPAARQGHITFGDCVPLRADL
jgi:hypothetical protein